MATLAMLGGTVKGHGKDSTAASSWFAVSLDQAPPAPTMGTGQDINAERPEMGATRGATAAGAC